MAREKKLWAGRINASMAHSVEAFTSSIAVDRRLYRCDITGSIAHVKMLARQRIILLSEAQKIVRGLKAIKREMLAERADIEFRAWMEENGILGATGGERLEHSSVGVPDPADDPLS